MSKKTISTGVKNAVLYGEILKESDRGCTLLIGTILEVFVESLHRLRITLINAEKKDLFEKLTGQYAPLGNFAGKIQMAYAYDLIDRDDYNDLELFRKIRNEAAHCFFDFNLDNAGIKAFVSKLTAHKRILSTSDRSHFNSIRRLVEHHEKRPTKHDLMLNGFAQAHLLEQRAACEMKRSYVK